MKNSFLIIGLMLMAAACTTGPQQQSKTTGWNLNDPQWGGYEVSPGYRQPTPPGTTFIEGGSFVMGKNQEDLLFEYNNIPRKVSIASFYMDETETSNAEYREYLYWLERIYGSEYPEVVRQASPDEFVWRNVGAYAENMVDLYFRHPAYQNYPVVGVSWEQAVAYCDWRSDRVNEKILIDRGILKVDPAQTAENNFNTDAYLAGQYEGVVKKELRDMNPNATEKTRKVRLEDGILLPKFRLPTEAEWEYAALGLVGNSYDERVLERRVYPWNGTGVRFSDPSLLGQMRANFVRGRGDYMGVAGSLNDGAVFTTHIYSYHPNDYGLYNMGGNVSEWVMDVYRVLSAEDVSELNPFRGNVYMTKVRDEEGLIAEKDSLGRIQYREVTTEESANRRNYQKSDNRNFGDGDYTSAIVDNWLELPEGADANASTSNISYEFGKTSLVTDRSRVVKGGSWKDRAYWLSPGNRRFLEQDQSTEWIGFRCAMSRVGSAYGANYQTQK